MEKYHGRRGNEQRFSVVEQKKREELRDGIKRNNTRERILKKEGDGEIDREKEADRERKREIEIL